MNELLKYLPEDRVIRAFALLGAGVLWTGMLVVMLAAGLGVAVVGLLAAPAAMIAAGLSFAVGEMVARWRKSVSDRENAQRDRRAASNEAYRNHQTVTQRYAQLTDIERAVLRTFVDRGTPYLAHDDIWDDFMPGINEVRIEGHDVEAAIVSLGGAGYLMRMVDGARVVDDVFAELSARPDLVSSNRASRVIPVRNR